MKLPDYWLYRPAPAPDAQARVEFDELLARVRSTGPNTRIHYTLPYPKWQFLCHIADTHPIVLHGTGDPAIQLFEPRQSNDLEDFGNHKAVYAAGDGLWAMFFAVVDRAHFPMTTMNACIRLVDAAGQEDEPYYLFSISQGALRQQPWRTGTVYLLPVDTFAAQPPVSIGPAKIKVPQFASPAPVLPMGRIEVGPQDFPFLANIRGLDDARMAEYVLAMDTGGPWPED